MKTLLIVTVKLVVAIAAFFIILFGYAYYQEYPARAFCSNIQNDMTSSEVINQAKKRGLPFFDYLQTQKKVWILNHKSLFFRVTCEIYFNQGSISSKGIVGAD